MKYDRFEDLPAWRAAMDLAVAAYALTEDRAFNGDGDARDQLRRAALSVSNNIAEGFELGTTPGLLNALYIARGSAGEVRSILCFCERWPKTAHLKSQISDLKSLAESCSRQIRAWAAHLQNSAIKGQRHLNDQTRQDNDAKRRSNEFMQRIEETVREQVEKWSAQNQKQAGGADREA